MRAGFWSGGACRLHRTLALNASRRVASVQLAPFTLFTIASYRLTLLWFYTLQSACVALLR